MAAHLRMLICAAAASVMAAGATTAFSIDIDSIAHVVDARYLSLAFDASVMRGADPFGFFSSQRVSALLAGLAPAYFRFSGTAVDSMTFNASAACDNKAPPFCLNTTQLTNVLNLSTTSGLDLILGVNGRLGKSAAAPNAPWDSSNAALELKWLDGVIATTGLRRPYAYELGDEPDLWPWSQNGTHLVNGSQLAADVDVFRAMIAASQHIAPDGDVVSFGPVSYTHVIAWGVRVAAPSAP